jgi:hypothetical protein
MSSEDFQKPENHAAIEKTLADCGRVLANDPRAENCRNARNAKFALDTAEIARVRRAQAVARVSGEEAGSIEKQQALARMAQDIPNMSAEDFRKPENHAAMEKALAGCGPSASQDLHPASCRNARIAKLMLDTAEIGRIRRAQALARDEAGASAQIEKASSTSRKVAEDAPAIR